ncbi:protein STPG4-like isoform X2 [Gigantopelta aegis]|uniref:protein STPG4-like isoform X2 n=1 Tax=Gigantopelta aegis TaxID=1735272 RepID=UPI001B88DA96|nr:protein STPG4-like isoform X2 [Gigantopelta aegis]
MDDKDRYSIRMRPSHVLRAWTRKALREDYELPLTEREAWWRIELRETPKPGAYAIKTFLNELSERPNTYRFKSDGRKLNTDIVQTGATLLPGAYSYTDFIHETEKRPATYNFRSVSRDDADILYYGKPDKTLNISPAAYDTERYESIAVTDPSSKHYMFKSQSKRFPTIYYKPKEGPGPGMYEPVISSSAPCISSSFCSRTPRFLPSHTKVPGPGTYEKTYQHPMKSTISKMGRQYGLFFNSSFQS